MTMTAEEYIEVLARTVLNHPAVARLDGGAFGHVASSLPRYHLLGVRATERGKPIKIAVVLRPGHPILEVMRELRERVDPLADGAPVDITVVDIDPDDPV